MSDAFFDVDQFRRQFDLADVVWLSGSEEWTQSAATRFAQAIVCVDAASDVHPCGECGACSNALARTDDVLEVTSAAFNQLCEAGDLSGVREAVVIVRGPGQLGQRAQEILGSLSDASVGPVQVVLCSPTGDRIPGAAVLSEPTTAVQKIDAQYIASVFPAIRLAWRSSDPDLYLALRTARVRATQDDILMICLTEPMSLNDYPKVTARIQESSGVVVRLVPLSSTVVDVMNGAGFTQV